MATGPRQADGIAAGYVFRTSLEDQAHAIVHPTLAPAGYAYLLIWNGRATFATSVFRNPKSWRPALDATVEAFTRLVPGPRLEEPRWFGGYGGLLTRACYSDESGRLYVGEVAGLQDAEWGFRDGVLAANSLLAGRDYATLARREFEPTRAAGVVNRAVEEELPQRLVDAAVRFEAGRADLPGRLRRH